MIRPIAAIDLVRPWAQDEMLAVASRAVGKVVRDDMRALTGLSVDEIAAMAGALVALGLIVTLPGETVPARLTLFPTQTGGPDGQP